MPLKYGINRRGFLARGCAVLAGAFARGRQGLFAQDAVTDQPVDDRSVSDRPGGYEIVVATLQPFPMTAVRTRAGPHADHAAAQHGLSALAAE